jgi:cytochrome P450
MNEYIESYGRNSTRRTLLTKLLAGDPASGTEPLPDSDIRTEVSNLILAATDTTGITMAYALYRLGCHPEWQDKLRGELKEYGMGSEDFNYKTLQSLPILNGVVLETLRLHPVVPGGLPRVTTKDSTIISGIHVPSKV